MTACTPLYGLTFPIGSDRPCDVATPLCAFATSVEAQLDALDVIENRTILTVPMARVRCTVVTALAGGTYVVFDTVDYDTDNMVDLVKDSTLIAIARPGLYNIAFNVQAATTGISALGQASAGGLGASAAWKDNAVVTPLYASGGNLIRVGSVNDNFTRTTPYNVRLTASTDLPVPTIQAAAMAVTWVAD